MTARYTSSDANVDEVMNRRRNLTAKYEVRYGEKFTSLHEWYLFPHYRETKRHHQQEEK